MPISRFGFSGFTRRYPYLLAWQLVLRNRVSRCLERPFSLAIVVALIAILAGGMVWIAHSLNAGQLNAWVLYIEAHGSWLLLLAALQAATSVARRRKELSASLRDSWLAATPRAALTIWTSLFVGVLEVLLSQFAMLVTLLLILRYAGNADGAALWHLAQIAAGGFLCGGLLGLIFSRKRLHQTLPGSRYVPGKKLLASHSMAASLAGLSRWPIMRTFAGATPDTVRWPVMAAMMSVMGGSSIMTGLGVVGFWMLLLYGVTLFASTLRVADEAAYWLRSTPLSLQRFAIAIGGRSFVHQVIAAAVVAAYLAFDKFTVLQAVLFIAPWIAFVMLAYSTAIICCFNARRGMRARIALSALSIIFVETLQRGAAAPFACIVCIWQWQSVKGNQFHGRSLHADK